MKNNIITLSNKRGRGRPTGTGRELGQRIKNCYKCGSLLNAGDPTRKTKYEKNYFTGLCRKCADEKTLRFQWGKRGSKAIKDRILQLHKEQRFLLLLLEEMEG